MSKEVKPYKSTKKDHFTIVLEGLRSDFRIFGDGLQFLGAKFDKLESKFDKLESRFDTLEFRFDNLELRFDKLETRFDTLELKFDHMDRKMDAMSFDIFEIKKILQKHNEKFDDHEKRISYLENA